MVDAVTASDRASFEFKSTGTNDTLMAFRSGSLTQVPTAYLWKDASDKVFFRQTNSPVVDDDLATKGYADGLGGGGVALSGSTNNTITTVTGTDAIQGEANLTFDGTEFVVTGEAGINVTPAHVFDVYYDGLTTRALNLHSDNASNANIVAQLTGDGTGTLLEIDQVGDLSSGSNALYITTATAQGAENLLHVEDATTSGTSGGFPFKVSQLYDSNTGGAIFIDNDGTGSTFRVDSEPVGQDGQGYHFQLER